MLMNTSTNNLGTVLDKLTRTARSRSLNDTGWAARAGLRKETLSRLRHKQSCDFKTLLALADAVEMGLEATSMMPGDLTPDGHFPAAPDREYEERLFKLCASGSLDALRWTTMGPGFFMAGLAVMVASGDGFDRPGLLALAEHLHPGASEHKVFQRWLDRSPVRPSRFLPMLDMEVKHAD